MTRLQNNSFSLEKWRTIWSPSYYMDENYPAGPEAAFTSHSHVEMVAHFMVAKVQHLKK